MIQHVLRKSDRAHWKVHLGGNHKFAWPLCMTGRRGQNSGIYITTTDEVTCERCKRLGASSSAISQQCEDHE